MVHTPEGCWQSIRNFLIGPPEVIEEQEILWGYPVVPYIDTGDASRRPAVSGQHMIIDGQQFPVTEISGEYGIVAVTQYIGETTFCSKILVPLEQINAQVSAISSN